MRQLQVYRKLALTIQLTALRFKCFDIALFGVIVTRNGLDLHVTLDKTNLI